MRRQIITVTSLVSGVIMLSCNASKMTLSNSKSWLPDDFNPATTILLIQKFPYPEKTQQQMEAYMKDKYPYKYEFASTAAIKSRTGKYADTKVYRYALVTSMYTSTLHGSQSANTRMGLSTVAFDFYFMDRTSLKKFPDTNKSSTFAFATFKPVINTILHKYE